MISEYDIHKKLAGLSPLTDRQLQDLWAAAPYPETKKLLWEIRRLHRIIEGLHRSAVALTAGYTGAASSFETAARELVKTEPCVQAYIAKSSEHPFNPEAWFDSKVTDLQAEASARYRGPDDPYNRRD